MKIEKTKLPIRKVELMKPFLETRSDRNKYIGKRVRNILPNKFNNAEKVK